MLPSNDFKVIVPLCFLQDFNLPLAVALGACSFEAYNLPYHMYGVKVVIPPSCSVLPQACTFPSNACIVQV